MFYKNLILLTTLLAFATIILGANTRLSNAGLSCPDWPGCYGKLWLPKSDVAIKQAEQLYPQKPLKIEKAGKEMLHRYLAASLGLLVLFINIFSWKNKKTKHYPIILPAILLIVVILQALLGMWTVTLLLKPIVVLSHLLLGFTTLVLLFWLSILSSINFKKITIPGLASYKKFAALALLIVICQISLGGWTSSNYAALVCPDFPTCQKEWFPEVDFKQAFVLWREVGIDYEGGVLSPQARMAIHITHRLGAIICLVYLLSLVFIIVKNRLALKFKRLSIFIAVLVCSQFLLGISNVVFSLPLFIATLHNAVAAILLLSVFFLNYLFYQAAK
ncbi:MAG: COX15/CtaA family protein [Pseudomonadota bacterium]